MNYQKAEKMNDSEFSKYFEERVKETISKFNLLDKGQKILVAASGGKDSTVLLYVLKKLGYDVNALTINAHIGCYSDTSLENLRKFCSEEKIKLQEVELRKEFGYSLCYIISLLKEKGLNKSSCSVCGTLRRYLLNKYAKKMNADIILTGHNLDDEADAMMMALFSGNLSQIARTGPITGFNSKFVQKAKPLYFLFEDEVERYSKIRKFPVHYGWCPCSEKGSRRFYNELNIEPERKFNLVNNMLAENSNLKKYFSGKKELLKCKNCSEPSANELCQVCNILLTLKTDKLKGKPEVNKCDEGLCNSK